MKNLVLSALLVFSLSGCCLFGATDEALLREIRRDMAESLRPALVDAMHKAKKENGSPAYIKPYKDEKTNLADTVVEAIDRVYPPVDEDGNPAPYQPELVPWR